MSGEGKEEPRKRDPDETADVPPAPIPGANEPSGFFFDLRKAAHSAPQPERVGSYRIIEVLGEGGMGVVYLAEQTEPVRRRVALKLVKLGMDTREVIARFETERQALAVMSHPHIARVFDAGVAEGGRPYFVMEHVPGISITDYCDLNRLNTPERLELFLRVCEAAQHAHQKGIIHRDLKPSNILVMLQDGRPFPKIIDFGVAKATGHRLSEKTLYTERGQIIGTPEYMSPEQAEMGAMDIDTRTDIYSLGVLLYELLVGALPFDSKELRSATCAELQRKIREVDPPSPTARFRGLGEVSAAVARKRRCDPATLLRQLRGDLDWITAKAIEKDRTRRYASASELGADIVRHLAQEPVLAGPPGTAYRLKKLLRRNRSRVWTAGTAAALIIAFLAATWIHRAGEAAAALAARTRTGQELLVQARGEAERYFAGSARKADAEARWAEAVENAETWAPPWEREEEIKAWKDLLRSREDIGMSFVQSLVLHDKALEAFPPGEGLDLARHAKEDFLWRVHQAALRGAAPEVRPEFFQFFLRRTMESVGLGTHARELEGRGTVVLEPDPPADEVYCFLLESHEGRFLPVPFHPSKGRVGEPFLLVDKVEDPQLEDIFRADDRILEVAGQAVRVPGDLARAVLGVGEGRETSVKLLRDGEPTVVKWTPLRPRAEEGGAATGSVREGLPRGRLVDGRLIDIRAQLGLRLAGYPLDLLPACRLESSGAAGTVEADLPMGEYLFVLRKQGFEDVRYPVAVPEDAGRKKIRLVGREDVPEGFIYIPGDTLKTGTDPDAYQGLPRGEAVVESFFMNRREVTFREYLEFLNDPEVRARIGTTGTGPTAADWSPEELRALRPSDAVVAYVPLFLEQKTNNWLPLVRFDPDQKLWKPTVKSEDWPILGVSLWQAVEYAHWLTTKKMRGSGRTFRLPREAEWERAARGSGRRAFVWGDYPMWAYCRSAKATVGGQLSPDDVEGRSTDESVFGVRDLAGSVSEPTLTLPDPGVRRFVYKGGSWQTGDDRDFRIASRNRRPPEMRREDLGIRIIAEARKRSP